MKIRSLPFLFLIFMIASLTGCAPKNDKPSSTADNTSFDWDSLFTTQGLLNVRDADSTILVDLRYSSENNFIGKDLYGSLEEAYLQPESLDKLLKASKLLKEQHPDLRLLIYDTTRPRRVQQILWDEVDIPIEERSQYVADPQSGSIHNYGGAVDLTLVDETGQELDMGTDYDDFSQKAHIDQEQELIEQGILTKEQVMNRKILRDVMTEAGFIPLRTEWWHFDAYPRDETKEKFEIVE